jgi:hypothetical protein
MRRVAVSVCGRVGVSFWLRQRPAKHAKRREKLQRRITRRYAPRRHADTSPSVAPCPPCEPLCLLTSSN